RQARGATCFESGECAPADFCDDSATCPGTCSQRKGAGQPAPTPDACAEGLFDDEGTCKPLVATGQSCAPADGSSREKSCVEGSVCNAQAVCAPSAKAGEPCEDTSECVFGFACGASGTCEGTTSVGGACTVLSRNCRFDLSCQVDNPQAFSGTCQPLRSNGGSCLFDFDCQANLYCSGASFGPGGATPGACYAYLALDGDCTSTSACGPRRYCSAGACKDRLGVGAACTGDDACSRGLACETGTCAVAECRDAPL
ncbi:MAG: hypothetical protein RL653_4351, partial [Pseudomonadota bacterium]